MLDLFLSLSLTDTSQWSQPISSQTISTPISTQTVGNHLGHHDRAIAPDSRFVLAQAEPDEVETEAIEVEKALPNDDFLDFGEIPPLEPIPVVEIEYQTILPLPGELNQIPVFNSNSPEVITQEGILLSTFPRSIKAHPYAHLETPLEGRFDIFTHHISRPAEEPKTLYQGLLVNNPTGQIRTIRVLQGLSYLNSQDAPFRELPPFVNDPHGHIYSGPGSRLVGDLLRGKTQDILPQELKIPPYSFGLLFNLPIPPSGSRSTYLQLESDGGLYLANLAKYEITEFIEYEVVDEEALERQRQDFLEREQQRLNPGAPTEIEVKQDSTDKGFELDLRNGEIFRPPVNNSYESFEIPTKIIREPVVRSPSVDEWRKLLTQGTLVEPRDRPPNTFGAQIVYGRVGGVSVGSQWQATVTHNNARHFIIPAGGEAVSFPISLTNPQTFDAEQVHSAPMLARYLDTALLGHGNYLVHYDLTFPLHNPTPDEQQVSLLFQTPIKENQFGDRLTFFETPPDRVFYRGTVRIRYPDAWGDEVTEYYHIVQRRGERGQPLATLTIPSKETVEARIDFFYPPDATPPQVITVQTAN